MFLDRFLVLLFALAASCAGVAPAMAVVPAPAAGATTPRLYITTEQLPPSNMMEGGRVIGIATDKVREAMRRTGVAYSIDMLPWKRAYHAALTRPDACVYSTTRTPEREALFKWVGPTDIAQWVLLGRAARKLQLRSLEDARGLRIGTYNGDAREAFLRSRGFTIDSTTNDWSNLNKLLAGRIDLWAVGIRSGSTALERLGYDKEVVPLLVFKETGVYLACNRAVPDELVNRLNAAFAAIARDGTGRRIERSYEGWEPGSRPRPSSP